MIVTIVVSTSQVVTGLFVDHSPPRALAAACGAATLLYALAWRFLTRRIAASATELQALSS